MTPRLLGLPLGLLLAVPLPAAEPKSVAEILAAHDRAVMHDLDEYVKAHPKADDRDEAYSAIFDRAIAHDWFADSEPIALRYLKDHPDGGVKPMARIVSTMARAQAGKFAEALATYKELMKGIDRPDQEEFATNFADHLAGAATTAGEVKVAREVYELLLGKFDRPELKQKVEEDLARLDRIGKPAPAIAATDIAGKPVALADYKGKYVLVDFWATWCAPCVAEIPSLQAAYAKHHPAGFEVLAVSLDDKPDAVVDYVKARKLPWRQVHNATAGVDVVDAFGVANIPASFLIGPDGTILRLDLRGQSLERALGSLLKPDK